MTCQHVGCQKKAVRMVGYKKWCGIDVNIRAVCPRHIAEAKDVVDCILITHSSGFATYFDRNL